jgi:hypothetical protein
VANADDLKSTTFSFKGPSARRPAVPMLLRDSYAALIVCALHQRALCKEPADGQPD